MRGQHRGTYICTGRRPCAYIPYIHPAFPWRAAFGACQPELMVAAEGGPW